MALDIDVLLSRFEACESRLRSIKTVPKPHDLYFAVKREGVNTGWGYQVCGLGLDDIEQAVQALKLLRHIAEGKPLL